MKNMKRAIRRHHAERVKNKYYKHRLRWIDKNFNDLDHEWARKEACLMEKTAKRCSCWMCGNPRRHKVDEVETLSEIKNEISFKEECDEYFEDI